MTSEERSAARRQREEQRRREKKMERLEQIGTAEDVFSFDKMYKYGKQCCRGVNWKQSIQNFDAQLFSRTAVNRKHVLNGGKPKKLREFTLNERGKTRNIEAPHVDDRQVQKTVTKEVLLPMYLPQLIYDNGASLKGKGLHFSQRLLDQRLREHKKRYGMNGYVIVADFKGFFPNADRNVIKQMHQDIPDPKLRGILDSITDLGRGDKGLPLGVEPSQAEMIALPSKLDSYMTCQVGLRGYGHYMDDYYMLVPPDRDPKEILRIFTEKAAEYGITISESKTRIVPFGKPFKFCKMKRIFDGDRIIHRGSRDSLKRARRKIKKFARTEMKYSDIYTSLQSTFAYFERTDDHNTILKLRRLFYANFGFEFNIEEFRKRGMDELYMPPEIQEGGSEREGTSDPSQNKS